MPKAEEVQPIGKGSRGRRTHCTPLPLPFKDNLLESQIPTWAFTLACTSNQFRSSWMLGPNHTSRMRMDLSLQWKGPGRVSLPLQHQAANLWFCQSWPWLLQSTCTRKPPSSQPLYPGGGIQRLWYHQRTWKPLPKEGLEKGYRAGPDLFPHP